MFNKSIDNILGVFAKPDIWLACIDLGNDRVYGKIIGNKALLEGIPEPDTDFRFNVVVEVSDPIGTTNFRDEQISVYKAKRILHSSNLPTFSFEAVVPTSADWFDLSKVFENQNAYVRFPFQSKYPVNHWGKGYCVASSIKEVESIFEEFIVSGNDRKVKNIVDAFDASNETIDGRKFVLELMYPEKFTKSILILLSLSIISFLILAIKVGLNSGSELLGFIIAILFFIGVGTYFFLRLNREILTLNRNEVLATYLIKNQIKMRWENVSEIKFSKRDGSIILKDIRGGKLK